LINQEAIEALKTKKYVSSKSFRQCAD